MLRLFYFLRKGVVVTKVNVQELYTLNYDYQLGTIKLTFMSEQANNPLHGVKLADILEKLVAHHGWEEMGRRINIRCFNFDPSIKSSLKFLRRTPWARTKVEQLYLETL